MHVRSRVVAAVVALVLACLSVALSSPAQAADDGGRIEARYQALGGAAGVLGAPTSEPYDTGADGRARDFTGGRIVWSPATDAWDVPGPIADRYVALGGPSGPLGFPVAAPAALTDPAGHPTGSEQVFAGGRFYVSAATGVHVVTGAVLTRYLQIDATRSSLGYPSVDTASTPDGASTTFTGGRIDQVAATGVLTVTGTWSTAVRRVTAAEIPYTYRSGCPVAPAALRWIVLPYYDWAGVPRRGVLVARATVVADLQAVFHAAFDARFPIRKMTPVDAYRGNDIVSMAADNTSTFNCRKVTGNPYRVSQHSYGNAIDINTLENPYVTPSRVYPSAGRTFLDRASVRVGMIMPGGVVARAMAARGWRWGARWSHPDYQHFSANGG